MLSFSACLFKPHLPKSPVFSEWLALTGLSRQHAPLSVCISSASVFATTALLRSWLRTVTVQLYRNPKEQLLKTGCVLCSVDWAFWHFHSIYTMTSFIIIRQKISLPTIMNKKTVGYENNLQCYMNNTTATKRLYYSFFCLFVKWRLGSITSSFFHWVISRWN